MPLEFVPFDEPEPAEGVVVEFLVANPDDDRETFAISLTDPPEKLLDADEQCTTATRLTFIVGYPFSENFAVTVDSADGFDRGDLFRHVVRIHSAMYEGATFSEIENLDNTLVESPRFGTAYHRIQDLVLEDVLLDHRPDQVLAWVFLGS